MFEILVSTDEKRAFIRAHWDIAGIDALDNEIDGTPIVVLSLSEIRTSDGTAKFTVNRVRGCRKYCFSGYLADDRLELHESEDNKVNAQKLVNLRQLNPVISVFDYNDDGYWDALLLERTVRLFVNDGRGGVRKRRSNISKTRAEPLDSICPLT